MLPDELMENSWQFVLLGHLDPVLDVPENDQQAHRRSQIVVAVDPPFLVLCKIPGFGDLTDVVVQRTDLGKEPVGSDPLARGLRQSPQHQAVVVGPRGFPGQKLQKRAWSDRAIPIASAMSLPETAVR